MIMNKEPKMESLEAAAIIAEVFGYRGQSKAAAALRRTDATINRWCNGVTPVRSMEARVLRLLLALHRAGVDWRPMLEGTRVMDDVI